MHFWLKLTKLYQDPAQFLIASLELHDNANMYNSETYGSITGDAFKPSAKPNPLAPAKPSVKESAAPSIFARGSKDKTVKEETRKEVKKQVSTTNVEDEPVKVRAQFLYEWQEYGVLIIEKPRSSTSATAAATAINKAQPLNKSNSKKRIINSDTEEDEPSPAKPKASTSMSKGGSSKTALEPTSSMVAREDKAALEAMADMDVDFSDDEKSVAARPKAKEETKPLRKSATGRKVRRVKKTKREKDDKGYFGKRYFISTTNKDGTILMTKQYQKITGPTSHTLVNPNQSKLSLSQNPNGRAKWGVINRLSKLESQHRAWEVGVEVERVQVVVRRNRRVNRPGGRVHLWASLRRNNRENKEKRSVY